MTISPSETQHPKLASGVASLSSTRRAPAPEAAAAASRFAVLFALLLVALGAIGVRDAAVALGWVGGPPWLPAAFAFLDGLRPANWTLPAAIAICCLGAVLVAAAFMPRRKTAEPLTAGTAVYLARQDIARVAASVARDVPGVLAVRSSSTRRRVSLRCRVTGTHDDMVTTITDAVASELAHLQSAPRVVVRTRTEDRT